MLANLAFDQNSVYIIPEPVSLQILSGEFILAKGISYTFEVTNPDNYTPKYQGKLLEIPKTATTLKVITYKKGNKLR